LYELFVHIALRSLLFTVVGSFLMSILYLDCNKSPPTETDPSMLRVGG